MGGGGAIINDYSIKNVSGGGDHNPKKILGVGGPENFAILRVGGQTPTGDIVWRKIYKCVVQKELQVCTQVVW